MVKHYVEFFFPDYCFSKREAVEIEERNSELVKVPEGAFAYRFFDRHVEKFMGKPFFGTQTNFSAITYFGTEYSFDDIKNLFPESKSLISFMEASKSKRIVKTKIGNWQVLCEGDIVI